MSPRASKNTPPAKAGSGVQDAARRLMNLVYTLDVSRVPLSADQILSDEELGYGSAERKSDAKKFDRDRRDLMNQGIYIVDAPNPTGRRNECKFWTLDRERTYAAKPDLDIYDIHPLLDAINTQLERDNIPYRVPLERVYATIRALMLGGEDEMHRVDDEARRPDLKTDGIVETMWAAYTLGHRFNFSYRGSNGVDKKRAVDIWGIFMLDGNCYFVGYDHTCGGERTFRTDRVRRVYRPTDSPADRKSAPEDFSIADYLFLPFDPFGAKEGDELPKATFTLPASMPETEVHGIMHGKGDLSDPEGGLRTWCVPVRSMEAAASFALAHSQVGMRPQAPAELIEAWNAEIEKAVAIHGR